MIHFRSSCAIPSFSSSAVVPIFGISRAAAKNSEAWENGTEKTSVVSCEIGNSGFEVDGKSLAEELPGIGTASTGGAFCGEVFDKEPGNTNVINAMYSADYKGLSSFRVKLGGAAALTYLIDTLTLAIILYDPLPGRFLTHTKRSASFNQRAELRRV